METVISGVLKEMVRQGHEAKLFLLGGSYHEEWLAGLNHRTIGRVNEKRWLRYFKYATVLPAMLRNFKPDVIVGADGPALQLGWLIRRVCLPSAPIASWMHGPIVPAIEPALHLADFHLCINSDNQRHLRNDPAVRGRNVYLIHNPVEVDRDLPSILRTENAAHFVYVGRLTYDSPKNVRDFIRALGMTGGNWSASIVGDGPDRERLMSLASELAIDGRMTWLGWQERPWDHVESASALVMTSEYEGFGMVLAEAMARGVACVSSDCAGARDIVQNDVNGWLFPVGNTAALAAILGEITRAERRLPRVDSVRASVARFSACRVVEAMVNACLVERAARMGSPVKVIAE
ncbi:glycosyltransferase [Paraburkholderia xenovorans]|uniref:glycosyltransferase n=1 Tax=Paraburkholderia xenovorans TaxID=36873 RepID=UPI0038B9AA18